MDRFTGPGTQPADPSGTQTSSADNAALLAAITQCRSALETKIGKVGSEVLLRQDLRITEAEQSVSGVEDSLTTLQKKVAALETTTKSLVSRAEDAEGRARRNNLRFVGFPEGCEEGNVERFLTQWLKSWLPQDSVSCCFIIERAHRALLQKPPLGARPHPIIAKILNYHDRDAILKQARLKEPLTFNNARILIFPDYTRAVQQQRQSFTVAKARLRSLQLPYALLYAARLRVVYKSRTLFFDSLEEVFTWADQTVKVRSHTPPRLESDSSSGSPTRKPPKVKTKPSRRSRSRRRSWSRGNSSRSSSLSQPRQSAS